MGFAPRRSISDWMASQLLPGSRFAQRMASALLMSRNAAHVKSSATPQQIDEYLTEVIIDYC